MRRQFMPVLAAAVFAAGAASAETLKPIPVAFGLDVAEGATAEGAKAMQTAYAAYLPQAVLEKGILSIKPEGADYVVSWDIAKALADSGAAQVVKVAPFVYRVTPTAGGGWVAKANSLPKVTIQSPDPKQAQGGFVAFDGFKLESRYDPAAKDFLNGKAGLDAMKLDLKSKAGDNLQHVLATQSGIGSDLSVTAGEAPDSIDLHTKQAVATWKQTTAMLDEAGKESPAGELRQGATTGDGAISGLRAKAMGDLWRYFVEQIDADTAPDPTELKPKLQALLPLWKRVAGKADIKDVAFSFPGGGVAIKALGEAVDMTGVADKSSLDLFIAAKDVSVDVSGAPDWAKTVQPASLQFDVKAGVDGLDKAANLLLEDADFAKNGTPSQQAQDAVRDLMLGGHPHVSLSKTQLTTPLGAATLEGEADFTGGVPKAHGKATADNLDKVLELLSKLAENDAGARNALLGVTFVKGLARQEDGKLVWDLEYVGPNSVKVNGQVLGGEQP